MLVACAVGDCWCNDCSGLNFGYAPGDRGRDVCIRGQGEVRTVLLGGTDRDDQNKGHVLVREVWRDEITEAGDHAGAAVEIAVSPRLRVNPGGTSTSAGVRSCTEE
jgi:hypothetical protein